MSVKDRVFIVGGSSGIGLELTKIFLENGYRVVVSSRSATSNQELKSLSKKFINSLYLLDLDVESDDFNKELNEAWSVYDGLDIWFYNAASYEVMDIDSWNKEKFVKMNSTNYLGVVKIMTDILPYFKAQKSGKWVWNLSLSSYFGLPKGGGYSAPKAALLNLAQSIEPELKDKNIKLQIINHGFVKTRLTSKNDFEMPQLMSPEFTARKIFESITETSSFEIHFPFKLSLFLKFLALLPYKISLSITRRML